MTVFLEAGDPKNPTILFLHGGGLSSRMWQPQFERLSTEFHLIAPDMPGAGENPTPFTLAAAAAQAAALIHDRVPIGRAHLVGNSLGAAVVLEILRSYPEVAETAFAQGGAARLGKFLGKLSIAMLGIYKTTSPERLARVTIKQMAVPPEWENIIFPDLVKSSTVESSRVMIEALMSMELPAQNTVPLLAVVGSLETIPAKDAAKKMVRLIPHTQAAIVPNLGHLMNLQDPDRYCGIVEEWITDRRLPKDLVPLG